MSPAGEPPADVCRPLGGRRSARCRYKAGLVCAYLFTPDQPGHPIDSDEAAERLADNEDKPLEFLWLHFSLTNAATEHWLRRHVPLPEVFYESARDSSSTRVEAVADALLGVINDVQFFAAEASSASTESLYVARQIIPGLFGMNVRGIPFSESDAGFWTVLMLVVVVAGLGAALAWMWRTRS
jgi:Mg2+ and Co2+ transporter CorA